MKYFGGQVVEVVELARPTDPVVVFEFEEYPEPKALAPGQVRAVCARYTRYQDAADTLGASRSFVRQAVYRAKKQT